MSLTDLLRQIKASENFKIADDFKFVELDDMTYEGLGEGENPDQLEIWAGVKVKYEGEVPDSYRTLNYLIGEWVDSHSEKLTEVIQEHLTEHARIQYEGSQLDLEDSMIWEDQLDYMPRINNEAKTMIIDIELVLVAEPLEE